MDQPQPVIATLHKLCKREANGKNGVVHQYQRSPRREKCLVAMTAAPVEQMQSRVRVAGSNGTRDFPRRGLGLARVVPSMNKTFIAVRAVGLRKKVQQKKR